MPNLILKEDHEYCWLIASHIKDVINTRYAEERADNPNLPPGIVIRNIRNWDDFSVPISEFPLLKVYRNSDSFPGATGYGTTQASITYSTSYPTLTQLPDLLYWMALELQRAVVSFKYQQNDTFDLKNRNFFQVQYLIGQQGNTVYPFLRASFQFKDNKRVC